MKNQDNLEELLEDVRYVNQLSQLECQRIAALVRQRVAEASLPDMVSEALLAEIADHLAGMEARIQLMERAIRDLENRIPGVHGHGTPGSRSLLPPSEKAFPAAWLAQAPNMGSLQKNPDGAEYSWTGPAPRTEFVVPLGPERPLELHVRLVALIKPEFLRELQILVDNSHLPHRVSQDGNTYLASALMPEPSGSKQTRIAIVLPSTHSPRELGTSQDTRKLGVAINEISFTRPVSRAKRILARLRAG